MTQHIGLHQGRRTGERGRGFAVAALIIGDASIAAGIVLAIVWIAVIAPAIVNSGISSS